MSEIVASHPEAMFPRSGRFSKGQRPGFRTDLLGGLFTTESSFDLQPSVASMVIIVQVR